MPIYDYQCSSCGYKAEVMRKSSAPNIEVCPECASEKFSKQLSAPSFQLSGSGWYATDFKNGSGKTTNKESSTKVPSESSNNAEGNSEKKSESTPAAVCTPGCACH